MKKLIKKTAIALTVVTVLGGTWAVSGAYHSGAAGENHVTPAVYVQDANFTTDNLMASLNHEQGFGIMQTVKSVLNPVRNYFIQSEGHTFNGVPVHKTCFHVKGFGKGSGGIFTRFFRR